MEVIIDASVVAKWFFPDESGTSSALRLKEDFVKRELSIAVPLLIYYEVGNLLKTAIKALRIDRNKAFKAYEGFFELDFAVYSEKQLMKFALTKAEELDISVYDSSYITLAQYLQIPFYTGDETLLRKAKSEFMKHIEEYAITKSTA